MNSHRHTKLVHEGRYAAEVEVDLIDTDTVWSPYLSLSDAQKLDDVRKALRGGDLKRASQLARMFQLLRSMSERQLLLQLAHERPNRTDPWRRIK